MKSHRHPRTAILLAAVTLFAASCGGGSDDTSNGSASTDGPDASAEPDTTDPAPDVTNGDGTTAPDTDDTAGGDDGGSGDEGFAALGPPSGEPIVIGMVNTEGTPGLDFPEMRTDTDLAVDYLNEHGGLGGRPVQLEHCASSGSPETSQACAQELSGKGVELTMLGLDLFPGYDTFAAADIPVVGALPILPADYTADALFMTGGNLTTMGAIVALTVEHFGASSVGIISADNAGANGSEQALTAALDKAGVTHKSVKGGDNETDAGFQGLIREANSDDPDVLVSLYSDAGCIGAMRGRVSLGIDTPVISTAICGSGEVIDVVGDDALGWSFVGVGGPTDTPDADAMAVLIEPAYGDASSSSLGLGALGINNLMSLAKVANSVAAAGGEVTGASIYEHLATATDQVDFLNGSPLGCGTAAAYPSVCSFYFPIGEYVAGGEIQVIPGFEAVSVIDYLP
ncbi:MAG: ABC transporter substrate-binding protein [Ilumatobacteraceae bacterium]